MQTYEYKVIDVKPGGFWGTKLDPQDIENKINSMAMEGWELVNSLDMNAYEGMTSKIVFIFKRAKTF